MAVDIKTTNWLSIGILLLQIAIKLVKETSDE